jgi:hypothetical protein
MTYPDSHPYRYRVSYTWTDSQGVTHTSKKEMAFTAPKTIADVQALNTSITVTAVEVA